MCSTLTSWGVSLKITTKCEMVSGLQIALDCETVQGLWWPVCCRAEQLKVWDLGPLCLQSLKHHPKTKLRIIFSFYSTSSSFQNKVWPWNIEDFPIIQANTFTPNRSLYLRCCNNTSQLTYIVNCKQIRQLLLIISKYWLLKRVVM